MALTLMLGLPPATARAAASPLLAMFDTNHDNRVSASEYLAYMDKGFHRMDANGDSRLEPGELPRGSRHPDALTLAQHHRHVTRQFHRQDTDHDGYLSLAELMAPPR